MAKFWYQQNAFKPQSGNFLGNGSESVDLLITVTPIVCVRSVFGPLFLFSTLCPSSYIILLMGKSELVALL